MSRKKGLSEDEKKAKMKEFFIETKDVFTLKQLEKEASKKKGFKEKEVKDIAQQCLDDNMIKSDKIGSSVYYWQFPSDETNSRLVKKMKLEKEIGELKRKRSTYEEEKKQLSKGREDTAERRSKIAKLNELKDINQKLIVDLNALAENNPLLLKAMQDDTKDAKVAINKWTDNIFSLQSYVKNKLSVDPNTFNKNFGIPDDFDYIE